jgi:hypothetical protein
MGVGQRPPRRIGDARTTRPPARGARRHKNLTSRPLDLWTGLRILAAAMLNRLRYQLGLAERISAVFAMAPPCAATASVTRPDERRSERARDLVLGGCYSLQNRPKDHV